MRAWRNGRRTRLRIWRETVRVQVPSPAPNAHNPNHIVPIGDGFGFVLYFKDFYTAILPYDNHVLLNEVLDLKELQQKVIQFAAFCFDIENMELKKLTAEERYYCYNCWK